jgi:hypothetical protein
MLYCIYIIIKRSYPALRVRVINCEIRVVIYTLFKLFGSECFRKQSIPHLIFIMTKVNPVRKNGALTPPFLEGIEILSISSLP